MSEIIVKPLKKMRGAIEVPGDKSISHRALMLGALTDGSILVENFLPGGDCLATLNCLRNMGVRVDEEGAAKIIVHGVGICGLHPPQGELNCVRSGTTIRLLMGLMAGQSFDSILNGEEQLRRRPMNRVAEPLMKMGAAIQTTDGKAPVRIRGQRLTGADLELKVASAQVKSAIILAGLYAEGVTTVHQPGPARDHTERMLKAMGAPLEIKGNTVSIHAAHKLNAIPIHVPGDFSSAAFPLVAGAIVENAIIEITNVGLNHTRTGLLDVLLGMGADISIQDLRVENGEEIGTIVIKNSSLNSATIDKDLVVRMIDEFPVFAVAATQASGTTIVRDARDLRVKETDRISVMVEELKKMGAHIEETDDGFVIEGPTPLNGGLVNSHGDHRVAMALTVAGLISSADTIIQDGNCVGDSFPGFYELMENLGVQYG
jgi:3-phosphoshikimate 1-carboxyvinyltransferase